MIEHRFGDNEELVIPLKGDPVLLTFAGSTEEAEFRFEHTGEYAGNPDPFTWTTITALSMSLVEDADVQKELSGKFIPELLNRVADGQTFRYNPSSAKYIRLVAVNEAAKSFGVSVDVH